MLHVLGWLFAVPLGCFLVHATAPLIVTAKARFIILTTDPRHSPPAPQPQNRLQDCLLVTLAFVTMLSTLAVLGFVLGGRDMIFGGPNQLGGTGE